VESPQCSLWCLPDPLLRLQGKGCSSMGMMDPGSAVSSHSRRARCISRRRRRCWFTLMSSNWEPPLPRGRPSSRCCRFRSRRSFVLRVRSICSSWNVSSASRPRRMCSSVEPARSEGKVTQLAVKPVVCTVTPLATDKPQPTEKATAEQPLTTEYPSRLAADKPLTTEWPPRLRAECPLTTE